MLCKLQRFPRNDRVLVYNADRTFGVLLALDDDLRALFGTRRVVFHEVELVEGDNVLIDRKPVADPGW